MARILLITHISPPVVDGGSRVIVKLGEYLTKMGHSILLVSSNAYSTDDFTHKTSKHTPTGLPVYTIFHKPLKLISKVFPIISVFAKGPIFRLTPFIKTLIQIKKFSPNLIIAGPLPTTVILYAYFIKLITRNCKMIINASFHPTDPDFNNPLLSKVLKRADYLWTLTDFETNHFNNHQTLNLGNGIDPDLLKKTNKSFPKNLTLLYIGALAQHKHIKDLISIHQQLLPKFPSLKLIIAGQKTLYYPYLRPLLSQKNIITIFNFKDKKLKELIDSATILVSPSVQESFGLTLIEAWARKTPVIAVDIPSSTELVTKSQGGLIGLHNLEKLLKDQTLCQKLGQNGYNYVKDHYLWSTIAKDLCQKLF